MSNQKSTFAQELARQAEQARREKEARDAQEQSEKGLKEIEKFIEAVLEKARSCAKKGLNHANFWIHYDHLWALFEKRCVKKSWWSADKYAWFPNIYGATAVRKLIELGFTVGNVYDGHYSTNDDDSPQCINLIDISW